jgi:hypothetical protein
VVKRQNITYVNKCIKKDSNDSQLETKSCDNYIPQFIFLKVCLYPKKVIYNLSAIKKELIYRELHEKGITVIASVQFFPGKTPFGKPALLLISSSPQHPVRDKKSHPNTTGHSGWAKTATAPGTLAFRLSRSVPTTLSKNGKWMLEPGIPDQL